MAQVNAAENVITHERTIYLDNAADLKIYNWAGWYFRVLKTSSALVEITARIDNEGTEAKTLQLGAGWRHRYFEKLALSWAAQPGESITIEFGGNPLTYRPGEYESYVPSSVSAVEVSNTIAQAVPVKDNGTPLSVNDAALGASFNALMLSLATTALTVTQDRTPLPVAQWMPAGATVVNNGRVVVSFIDVTLMTVDPAKKYTLRNIAVGGSTAYLGYIWAEIGGVEIWRTAIVGGNSVPQNIQFDATTVFKGNFNAGVNVELAGYTEVV